MTQEQKVIRAKVGGVLELAKQMGQCFAGLPSNGYRLRLAAQH